MSRIAQGARSSRSPRRRARARVAGVAALAVVAASAAVGGPVPSPVEAETKPPVRILGTLPIPADRLGTERPGIIGFDPTSHRMYTWYVSMTGLKLATYDSRPTVPVLVVTRDALGTDIPSRYQSSLDLARRRLYWIRGTRETNGVLQALSAMSLDPGGPATITWDLTALLPGLAISGITYSPEDDRIYLVGELSGSRIVSGVGRRPASALSVIAALDPRDGTVVWARQIPECQQPLDTVFVGTMIARSGTRVARPTLLVPCVTGSLGTGDTYPGQSGLLALELTPTATMAAAQDFVVRFHPISGTYFNGARTGIAAFDPGSDRVFVQSLSFTTPGAWVFDARSERWVGFVTAPKNSDFWLGLNPTTGHYYMGGGFDAFSGFLLVTDGRASPPQNGVALGPELAPTGFVATDPGSNRFFVPLYSGPLAVLEDLTPSAPLSLPLDYDAQTDDMPETADTFVSFSGDADGFGSRVTHAGGLVGAVSNLSSSTQKTVTEASPASIATRGLAFAWSPGLAVKPAGAAATAQASVADPGTARDLQGNTQDPTDPPDPEHDEDNALVKWPHGPESCLDGGEGVENEPETSPAGYAAVTCNLKGYESTATARHRPVATQAAVAGVAVGDSRFESKVKRSAGDGMRTETTSSASGVHVEVPAVGSLDIGRVTVTATTVAHGRRGTAKATWTRTVDDVTVKDAQGKPLFQAAGCTTVVGHDGAKQTRDNRHTSCEAIAEAVRRALQVRVKLAFPTPLVEATPKGAFAGIAQSDADYYHEVTVSDQGKVFELDKVTRRAAPGLQLDVYNDNSERSRLVVQLAGVESSSIFTVNASLEDPPCDTGGCIPGDGSLSSFDDGASAGTATDLGTSDIALGGLSEPLDGPRASESSRRGRPASGESVAVGLVVARRGFGQGALMTSLVLLFAAAVGSVRRRRRLLASLSSA